MAKITVKDRASKRDVVSVRTMDKQPSQMGQWWKGSSKAQRANMALATASFLKEVLNYRYRQAAIYSRLYGNMPLLGVLGGQTARMGASNQLPIDRPTMNVVQSCVDTLVSRITQSKPRPVLLTDNGDYKERKLAKQLNQFINGELYQTEAYSLGSIILRDACVLGTGCIKIYRTEDDKVALERVLQTELLVDPNDALYGSPRQLYQLSLVDRGVLAAYHPASRAMIERAENAYPDNSADSSKTVSDLVMVVEGWHLPSGPDAGDGRHIIAIAGSDEPVLDEEWNKDQFPFVFLHYSPRMLGFFGQPLAEQLMGTQMEINKLLSTISKSINLVGVPRVFVANGSKVVKAHLNNEVGSIVTYEGTKPEYSVAPCVPAEMYQQLQRLVEYAYQQSGVSALSATSQKPAGLNSGAALREYNDLQTDRFATLNKNYDNMYIDLAYQIIDLARDIVQDTGKYQTVYPNKNGVKEIDLTKADLLNDSFVIQCFDASALPRDPAGRLQRITEMVQAGMLDIREGRRLLDYPDLEQNEQLANASEERILQTLDAIVEDGKYSPPDAFMDLQLAQTLSIQYYNLYVPAKLEEDRAEMLRTFNSQVVAMLAPPPVAPSPMGEASGSALAVPEPLPTSPLLPQGA